MYAIDRLTAPKPKWDTAVIFAKGVQPLALDPTGVEIRKETDKDGNDILIFIEKGVPDPFKEGENTLEFNHVTDKEVHFFINEIARIEFFSNSRRVKLQAPGPAASSILTAEGESVSTAKEVEENKEKRKNPLKKAED